MIINVQRNALDEALQTVSRAVQGKSTLPILSHLLISPDVERQQITITGTDLELWIERTLPAEVIPGMEMEDEMRVTVPAALTSRLVHDLPAGSVISLDREPGSAKTILSCQRSRHQLIGLPAEEFPAGMPSASSIAVEASATVTAADLQRILSRAIPAIPKDQTRAILCGVQLTIGDGIRAVATDTHRLMISNCGTLDEEGEGEVVLPSRAATELINMCKGDDLVKIRLDAGQAHFEVGDVRLSSRLIDGRYPRYDRVIPASHDKYIVADRTDLMAAVRRCHIYAVDNANRVTIQTQGQQIEILAESHFAGEAREEVEVAREGDDIQIAFHAGYVTDVLRVLDTEGVRLEMTEALRPMKVLGVGDDTFLGVLMPLQVC